MATIVKYTTKTGPRYRVRYRKPDGTQTSKRGFKTKRAAQEWLSTTDSDIRDGAYVAPSAGRVTVADLGERVLTLRAARLKPSTVATEQGAWNHRVKPRWGTRPLSSISTSEIEEWVAELSNQGLSVSSIMRDTGILRAIFKTAVRDKLVRFNPVMGIELPRKAKQRPSMYLTHAQVEALAAQLEGEKQCLLYLLAYTGLRWGEATALRVESLDMLRKRIRVDQAVYRAGGVYHYSPTKGYEARTVPFPNFLAPYLARQCEGRTRDALLFGNGLTPLPAPGTSKAWLAGAVRRCQAADPGFPRVTPHDLRHTAASLAISAGAHVKAVQRMLGHSSATTTLDTYADLFDADLDLVAASLNEARRASM